MPRMSPRLRRSLRPTAVALVLLLATIASSPVQAAPADSYPPRPHGLQPWSSLDREMALKAAVVDAFDGVEKAMAAKDYPVALDLLTRLRVVLPRNSTIANNLGYVLVALGHLDRALDAYRQANDLDPVNPIAAINVGQLLLDRGLVDEAARRLAPWTTRIATNPAVGFILVRLADAQGQPQDVKRHLKAILSSPRSTLSQVFDASGMLRDAGDPVGAAEGYRKVTVMDPSVSGAWMNLSDILRSTGRLAEAEKLTEEIVERFPEVGAAYFQRGLVHVEMKRLALAAQDFERAASLKKNLADGLLRAAACYTKLGRLNEARARVQSFLALGEVTSAPDRKMAARMLREIDSSSVPPPSAAGAGETAGPSTGGSAPHPLPALDVLTWAKIAKARHDPVKHFSIRMFGELKGRTQARFLVQVTVTESPVATGERPAGVPSPGPAPGPWATDVRRDLARAIPGAAWEIGSGRGPPREREYIAVARPSPLVWVLVEGQADDPRHPATVAGWAAALTTTATTGTARSAFASAVHLIESPELADATALYHASIPGASGDPLELWIRMKPSPLASSPLDSGGPEQRWHKPRPYDSREEGWAGVPGSELGEEFEDPAVARLMNPNSHYNHHKVTNGITQRVGRCTVDLQTQDPRNLQSLPDTFRRLVLELFPSVGEPRPR